MAKKRPVGRPNEGVKFGEVGTSGLVQYAGIVSEEWLPQLQGSKGVRAIKTMIGTDATVAAVMTAAKMAVKQVKWFVEAGGPEDVDNNATEHVEKCLFEYMEQSWAELMPEILTVMDYGWAWFEQVYEKRSEGTIAWKKWGFRPQESLYNWEFDPNNNELTGMNQHVDVPVPKTVLIPLAKSLHFTLNATKRNPEGVSLLRGAYMAWYAKHKLELIELIGIERNLAGLPDIKIPAEIFEKKNTAVLGKYMEIARKVHRNEDAYILTPSDPWPQSSVPMYSVGLVGGQQLTTRGTGLPTIQPIQRYQAEIARCLLADFMLLPSGGPGSYALSSNKSSFFVMFIESICDAIADIINKQAIPQLLELNTFGELTSNPKLVHGNVSRTEVADLGRMLANLYKAGAEMFPNDDLLNAALEEVGLPRITSPEPEPLTPEQLMLEPGQEGDIAALGTAPKPSPAQIAAGLPTSPAQMPGAAAAAKQKAGTQVIKPSAKPATKPVIKPKGRKPTGGG